MIHFFKLKVNLIKLLHAPDDFFRRKFLIKEKRIKSSFLLPNIMDYINALIIVLLIVIIWYCCGGLIVVGLAIGVAVGVIMTPTIVMPIMPTIPIRGGAILLPELDDQTEVELKLHNMNSIYFNNIRKKLESEDNKVEITHDIVSIDESSNIRKIAGVDGLKPIYEKKDSRILFTCPEYKIRQASEVIVPKPDKFNPTVVRRRYRRSYLLPKFPNVRFDLTIVNDNQYEVEIEMIKDTNVENLKKIANYCMDAMFAIGMALSSSEYNDSISAHNQLVSKLGKFQKSKIYYGYENKPQDLKPSDLINDYYLTLKYDGVRYFMMILSGGVYFIMKDVIYKIGESSDTTKELDQTLIDGEFMESENLYSAFDILIYKGDDITSKSFDERYKLLKDLTKLVCEVKIEQKLFFTDKNTMSRIAEALEVYDKKEREYDGLILQPVDGYYTKTKKWKPSHLLTIDFLVRPGKIKNTYILNSYNQHGDVIFKGTKKHPFSGVVKDLDKKYMNNIVEFQWENNTFVPMRTRDDRLKPNSLFVAMDVFDRIHEPISRTTLMGEDLTVIRRYNQTQKTHIMDKYLQPGDTILDIGSGRGADLSKWNKLGLKHVIIAEPDSEVLKILDCRKKDMNLKYDLTILNTGAEDTKAIKEALKKDLFDSINTFYSLTFFFENKEIFDNLIKTCGLIKTGGKIIGSVMDGGKTMKLLKNGKFENKAFRIEADGAQLGKFGQKVKININDPNSMIKDVEEYLFDFEYFARVLLANKFKLVENYFYSDASYKKIPKIQQEFGDLFRVFVFEKV